MFFTCKPNSVENSHLSVAPVAWRIKRHLPILPTAGGAKLSTLSLTKGLPLALLGMLNFVSAYGGQNWHTALHRSKSFVVAPSLLPERFTERLLARYSIAFALERHCSHLAPRGGRGLPATMLPSHEFGVTSCCLYRIISKIYYS